LLRDVDQAHRRRLLGRRRLRRDEEEREGHKADVGANFSSALSANPPPPNRSRQPAPHSGRTRPFFTANSASSAVLCTPSALIRFARCTATVFTLRSSITAISLFDLPCAMSCSTCCSRCVSRSYGSDVFSN